MAKKDLFATKELGDARRKIGLTQVEMADLLSIKLERNISVELYRKWEQGRRAISTNDAIIISREVGQSSKDLFKKGEYSFEQ